LPTAEAACFTTICNYCSDSAFATAPGCASATGQGDPHINHPHGDSFDFKGQDGTIYSLLSAATIAANARFQHTDYIDAGPKKRLIHGSFMTDAFVILNTTTGRELLVEYSASRAVFVMIAVDGAAPAKYRAPFTMKIDDVNVTLTDRKMSVASAEWVVSAASKYKNGILKGTTCATGKCFLDVAVKPLIDADHAKVAPHGLMGQGYDGDEVGIVGKRDVYKGTEFTTTAMGEGAIEGVVSDYAMAGKFATAFKFSRFGLVAAAPRSVTALSGKRIAPLAFGDKTASTESDGLSSE
jgi:hypothetical protein